MIGRLEGQIIFKGEKNVVLDVCGIGYKIFLSPTSSQVLNTGEKVAFWTHLHVKEDALELYGFLNQSELEFFEMLISISGIGPRSALGVLALAPVDTVRRAIGQGDASYLTKVSGIGKKIAEKIVLELKDKLGAGILSTGGILKDDADILEALVSLGYSQKEARDMISKIPHDIGGRDKRLEAALKFNKH